jgi:prephenate dehydrogenase
MSIIITIIGLGQIGTSVGLALGEHKDKLVRYGTDREPNTSRLAQKLGAIDRIFYNLPNAVEEADVVVLAIPIFEIKETLEAIAQALKPGAVVVDTSPVKVEVAKWASEIIPQDRYFVTLTPTMNPSYLHENGAGTEAAHADLFKDSFAVLTSLPGTDESAMQLAADLASLLGSKPFFCDPYESDGLMAASHLLPALLSVALLKATTEQPGWKEGRKVAGKLFTQMTEPAVKLESDLSLVLAMLMNRENMLRVIDDMGIALTELRTQIDQKNEKALLDSLQTAQEKRNAWWIRRERNEWEESNRPEAPTMSEVMGRLIGLGRKSKKPPRP